MRTRKHARKGEKQWEVTAERSAVVGPLPAADVSSTLPKNRFLERPRDFELLVHQLIESVPRAGMGPSEVAALMDAAVGLYLSVNPQDAIESILSRLIVISTNAASASLSRANRCDDSPRGLEVNLKHGFQGAKTVDELIAMPPCGRRPAVFGLNVTHSTAASKVADFLREHGASFFEEIVDGTHLLPTQAEAALAELVALGRAQSDGFDGLRR